MDSYDCTITPCDPLNPEFGYSIRVERNGTTLLYTAQHPVTGADLTYHSAVEVAAMYGPKLT